VLNGSMGFDDATLEPTYILRLGAPGRSAGLDIARRLGMPAALMERARAALSSREQDISAFLSELHRRLEEVGRLRAGLTAQQDKLVAREKALASEWEKREAAKLKELERRCELVLEKFDAQARQTIDKIAAGGEQKKALRSVGKAKRELQEDFDSTVLSTKADARQGELGPPKIVPGLTVRLKGIREPARVRRLIGADLLEVEAGLMKMQVSTDDVLEVLAAAGEGLRLPANVSFQPGPEVYTSVREINVIGQRAEEACQVVDKFLDSAVLAGVQRLRIVHGFGMGILRRAIGELLAANPNVEKFYPASQSEGGAGATIVELKE
jgi:DNA mismatch repair protein MutS2